jgi:hypothetical protein
MTLQGIWRTKNMHRCPEEEEDWEEDKEEDEEEEW